jgi:hypothetical protein
MVEPIKLDWCEDIDHAYNNAGINKAKVWRSVYKDYYIVVFPLKLIRKNVKGWAYGIVNGENNVYNSLRESNGQYSETPEEAMKLAKDKLNEILGIYIDEYEKIDNKR